MNKKSDGIDLQIKMMSSANRVLLFLKKYPRADDDQIFQDVMNFIAQEHIRDQKIIKGMIAIASKTIAFKRKMVVSSDKMILKEVMHLLSPIAIEIESTIS